MEQPAPKRSSQAILDLDGLELLDRDDLIATIKRMVNGGVSLSFHGKRTAMEIARKVRPRVTRRISDLHVGTPEEQSQNLLIEGENLQAMVTLYKYRGQVDLIVADPPYNTGQYFRYNDRWDHDPNDPELGALVTLEDGSRHTKWMKAMLPRLQLMKAMLKPQGVVAVCIDDNELFNLGLMMDEVFGEENRIAIINWQKTYAPKRSNHVSSATEYVLVYSKDLSLTKTRRLERTEEMNARFTNIDGDPEGDWRVGDLAAQEKRDRTIYAIQSPFSGTLHYPESEYDFSGHVSTPTRHWSGLSKDEIKSLLENWGSKYVEKDLKDGRGKALILAGSKVSLTGYDPEQDPTVLAARKRAQAVYQKGIAGKAPWPRLIFSDDRQKREGFGRPAVKRHLKHIAQGRVPWTFWADENYGVPPEIGSTSWPHAESGHSQSGLNELDEIVGKGHNFQTVKPLKLMKKIIQLWCPPNGLVMDPYAGSGTTGHAVLELNKISGANRRFILIEQGRPDNGDKYARTLTWQRLHNAITGERRDQNGDLKKTAEPLGGGFEFRALTTQIDAKTVLTMKKDELIDVVITSHWQSGSRNAPNLVRIDDPRFTYLVGKNERDEPYFIIWNNGAGPVGQLDKDSYNIVLQDAKKAELKQPYHVYARYELYQSKNVRFYKIPDKILAHLGLNENSDPFNDEGEN
ncbi:site-specific DNA-methyltransferase [Rhizobium sp. 1AS11]|uniref:site-specific DNA-methyltransferase n=1 Tax=Rhizobium acaciae TaxID=2989736 RepID=UPI0022216780|nr:site-specific DNA-methyltransferase [Rhizobium acaciae]MCW1413344.1 site-specific DNA-methyltransferase [Rhizobium acaciae]MCW1745494.1 site-specific DNA-methyltransferase [Rhizobium acaciae]